MPSNPLTPQEQYDILINRSLTPRDGVTTDTYMAAGYILMPPATVDGPVKWRLFDAAYVKTGIIDPNRLGTGATGAGNLYLADDGTWKVISGAPGVGDMLKSTYDTDNSGVVDNAEGIATIGRNSTGVTLYKGTVVYISGSTGNRPNFVKAQANSEATSAGTFGVIRADIPNNSDGYAVTIGVIDTLDTRSSATNPFTDVTLADGDTVYLHPTIAGYITNVKPSAPNHLVYVGKVTRTSPTNGTIVYRIQNGYELDELHDVAIASKANNDLLVYESATNLWKNKTFSAIFGGTPLVTVPTLDQVTTAGYTTTNPIIAGQYQIYGTTRNARLSSDNVGGFDINYNIGGTPDWRWFGGGTTALTTFKANGNVLIGTTTDAGYKLDVAGNTRVNGGNTTSDIPFIVNNRFQFRGDGVLSYGAASAHGRLNWDASGAYFYGLSGYGVGLGANGVLNHLFINTSGNVGIGTAIPTQKLDVVGNTKLRGVTFFGSINVPSTPTLTNNSTTGGTLAAGTYYYKVVAMDYFNNTTTASNELAVTTTGSTSSVSISWPVVPGAYNYRVYRGTTSGGQNTYFLTFGTNGNGYTDTGTAGTAGTPPTENTTSYGSFNVGDGLLRTGNILIANNGVGNISSINFDKTTDGPAINVVEYQNDSTMFEFSLADNPDGPDAFHFVMPDWQNPSSGWKPFKFAAFTTQIVGKDTNFWSSFSMPSSTPYYTTNDNRLTHAQLRYDPYTSTSYNLVRDAGTGTGNLNVDVTGYTGATYSIYWVTITSPTTFNWGNGSYGGTPVATGVTITGGWQVLGSGVQVRLTGTFVAADRWAFRVFPVPRMGIGTTTPIAPLQVSTTIAASSGTARGVYFNPTLVAAANNDVLVGLDIAPTFTTGAFTGISRNSFRAYLDANSWVRHHNNLGSNFHTFEIRNDNVAGSGFASIQSQVQTRINYMQVYSPADANTLFGVTRGGWAGNISENVSGMFFGTINAADVIVGANNTATMRIFNSTRNVLIQNGGTFTDAGYRLDVNGTFRAQGSITATLANTVTSSMVYYNSSTGLLTYGAVPTPTTFQIDYDYNIVGVKNGVNVVFTTSANFVLTTTRVYLNGQRLTRGVGYDYVETGTNQVTFANPLNPTDQIIIEYQI